MLKRVNDTGGANPVLDLPAWFSGRTSAVGLFEDRFGRLKRSFAVTVDGHTGPDGLTLEEDFRYTDGAVEHRTWRISFGSDGAFTGTAADVVGVAQGRVEGNVARMAYTVMIPVNGQRIALRFDDSMVLMPDNTLIAHARVSKFGFTVGRVIISFRKD